MSKIKPGSIRTQDHLTEAMNELIAPFEWKTAVFGSHCVGTLTQNERDAIAELVTELSDSRGNVRAPRPIPDAFWRIVLISPAVLKFFPTVTDAKAMACFLVPSTSRLFYWRSLALVGFADTALRELVAESLMALPGSLLTSGGAIYQECDGRSFKVWFGRKAGREKQPDMAGDHLLKAVRCLFQIGVR